MHMSTCCSMPCTLALDRACGHHPISSSCCTSKGRLENVTSGMGIRQLAMPMAPTAAATRCSCGTNCPGTGAAARQCLWGMKPDRSSHSTQAAPYTSVEVVGRWLASNGSGSRYSIRVTAGTLRRP